jgi:hypothetical protein
MEGQADVSLGPSRAAGKCAEQTLRASTPVFTASPPTSALMLSTPLKQFVSSLQNLVHPCWRSIEGSCAAKSALRSRSQPGSSAHHV